MPYIRFKLDLQNDLQRILYVYIYPPAVGICKRSSLCALTLFPTFTFFLCDMRNQRKKNSLSLCVNNITTFHLFCCVGYTFCVFCKINTLLSLHT